MSGRHDNLLVGHHAISQGFLSVSMLVALYFEIWGHLYLALCFNQKKTNAFHYSFKGKPFTVDSGEKAQNKTNCYFILFYSTFLKIVLLLHLGPQVYLQIPIEIKAPFEHSAYQHEFLTKPYSHDLQVNDVPHTSIHR